MERIYTREELQPCKEVLELCCQQVRAVYRLKNGRTSLADNNVVDGVDDAVIGGVDIPVLING